MTFLSLWHFVPSLKMKLHFTAVMKKDIIKLALVNINILAVSPTLECSKYTIDTYKQLLS